MSHYSIERRLPQPAIPFSIREFKISPLKIFLTAWALLLAAFILSDPAWARARKPKDERYAIRRSTPPPGTQQADEDEEAEEEYTESEDDEIQSGDIPSQSVEIPGGEESEEGSAAGSDEASSVPSPQQAEAVVPDGQKGAVHTVWVWQETRDCLWRLARTHYNDPWKWKKIYLANRNNILDPNVIFPKQRIFVPELEQQ